MSKIRLCKMAGTPFALLSFLILLSLILKECISLEVKRTLSLIPGPPSSSTLSSIGSNSTNINNATALHVLNAWPKLPWWTKIQDSNPEAFLDIYSLGTNLEPVQAYALQELALLPLSITVHRGTGPAGKPQYISNGNLNVLYSPNEHRPPSRDVAAKAIAALAFLEKKFGGRVVKAGLRLGMVKVAGIEVWLSGDVA